jgi:hypothetical protein
MVRRAVYNALNFLPLSAAIADAVRISANIRIRSASQAKTSRYLMKLLQTAILAIPLTVTATVGLAADYEIFAEFQTVETGVNHYAVERLDHKNKKLYHCTAVLNAETRQLSGQCAETPGVPENPTGKGPNAQGGLSNTFGGVPVFGSWKLDQTTGETAFCISGRAQCVDVTPQP